MTLSAVIATSGTAAAEDPAPGATEVPVVETVAPPAPEETDLIEVPPSSTELDDEVSVPTSKPSDFPDASACEPGYRYYPTTNTQKDYHRMVGITQSNYNNTTRDARSTFTSNATGEVSLGYSGELGVSANVAVLEIEGKFGVNVAVKMTAHMGNTISITTPPRTTTNARYGVYRLKTLGYSQYVYSNCNRGVKNTVTVYSPKRVGWYLWES
jgi:hypothetical protein